MMVFNQAIAKQVADIAGQASRVLMHHYHQPDQLHIEHKADASPVTQADKAAHAFLVDALPHVFTEPLLIISEEGDFSERYVTRDRYWCIDPLDGTKEFIARTGEFSINIAFIEQKVPVFGLIYHPLQQVAYVGIKGQGAYRYEKQSFLPIHTRPCQEPIRVVMSRRHDTDRLQNFFSKQKKPIEIIALGSALKFARVACGQADLFIRGQGSHEWDNAAGHCIVKAAGGDVIDCNSFQSLEYSNPNTFQQNAFFVVGDFHYSWKKLLNSW